MRSSRAVASRTGLDAAVAGARGAAHASSGRTKRNPERITAGTAGRSCASSEHAHRQERSQRVVRLAKAYREQPHARPEHLVGELPIEVEQHLEIGTRDREQ